MRQRREDARNIALIVGSGVLGAVATLVGVSLMGSSAEVRDHSARWEVNPSRSARWEVNPSRFQAESYRLSVRPVELHRVRLSEVRLNRLSSEHSRAVAEARARLEEAVAEVRVKNQEGDQSPDLQALQVRLQAELAELQARLEAVQSSGRDLEGTITKVQVRAGDPGAAPVVYVDGVRFDGAMEDLSPEDIESVDVIKGDAAIEAYGKEGENGVIIIKKRKPGKKRKGGGRR